MPYDYKSFIDEIVIYVDEAKQFSSKDKTWDSDAFRKWRHKTKDSIYRIQKLGYSINCDVASRQFHIFGYGPTSKSQQDKKFEQDLLDTINELELLIEQFNKYGVPTSTNKHAVVTEHSNSKLELPAVISLKWLFEHMPIKGWLIIFSLLVSAFGLGFGFHEWWSILKSAK